MDAHRFAKICLVMLATGRNNTEPTDVIYRIMKMLWLSLVLLLGGLVEIDAAEATKKRAVVALPDTVEKRAVTIWSDGTRMMGDLYLPKERKAGEKLPVIIFCNGTGGTRQGATRFAVQGVANGFAVLGFDYRGWGASESQLMALEPQPKPDAKGEMTVRVRALRWQMNYTDQTEDIRAAISFAAGEPELDAERIGLLGTSYGGGLVTWMAANDPRVKCVAAQVPGMGARGPAATKYQYDLHQRQARGEAEAVPFTTGKLGGKLATYDQMRTNPAKNIGFSPIAAAQQIKIPMIIIDAENEELMDTKEAGGKVANILKEKGVPVKYHVIKGITHYGVYAEGFAEATKLELEWFGQYLKGEKK